MKCIRFLKNQQEDKEHVRAQDKVVVNICSYCEKEIRHSDNVAYIRYASVYMDFSNSNDFQDVINNLVSN